MAQGVETSEQADFLRGRAYDEFQGFYFNEPVTAEAFTEILERQMQSINGETTDTPPSD